MEQVAAVAPRNTKTIRAETRFLGGGVQGLSRLVNDKSRVHNIEV